MSRSRASWPAWQLLLLLVLLRVVLLVVLLVLPLVLLRLPFFFAPSPALARPQPSQSPDVAGPVHLRASLA